MKKYVRAFFICISTLVFFTPAFNQDTTNTWSDKCFQVENKVAVPLDHQLPFFENWNSGDFETNGWTQTGTNWKIDTIAGNQKPSSAFDLRWDSRRFSESLQSESINALLLTEGKIWLDFQLKLDDNTADSTQYLKVEIYDGDAWSSVYTHFNAGSFNWEEFHFDISQLTMGKIFRVAFTIEGPGLSDAPKWFIDNIKVYRDCPGGCELEVNVDTVGYDHYLLNFSWDPCDITLPGGDWLFWDNGIQHSGIGSACPPTTSAVRWDAQMLADYEGYKISKIRFALNDNEIDYLKPKIWQGIDASELIYEDSVDITTLMEGWNTHEIEPPVSWDITKELWVGYQCEYGLGDFPHGCDEGPAVTGYGDLIECGGTWDTLSNLGLDYNFNLHVYLIDTAGNEVKINFPDKDPIRDYFGVNLYMSINGGEYKLIDFLPYAKNEIQYQVPVEDDGTIRCYKITAVWDSNTDYCESDPFLSKENPEQDFVCVLLTGVENKIKVHNNLVHIFPNPATNQLTIESVENIETIHIVNHLGQTILLKTIGAKQTVLNTSGMENGMYLLRAKNEKGIFYKKIFISK